MKARLELTFEKDIDEEDVALFKKASEEKDMQFLFEEFGEIPEDIVIEFYLVEKGRFHGQVR